jgi:hypothetical protein
MNRRRVLRRTGAVGLAGLLGGCLDDGARTGDDETTTADAATDPDPDPEPEPEAETTTETESVVSVRNAEMLSSQGDCGGTHSGTIRYDPDGSQVTVEGVIRASDPCHEAVLEDARYDADSDRSTVVVGVTRTGTGACQQCIADITYEAVVRFDGGLPGTVTLVHTSMGEEVTVTEASR